ncbi:MAG TPA: ligase-associated DNA damage response exonuclease [Gemmatimonadales bacterium]
MTLLSATDRGLFCEAGGFHVDPWSAVDRAIVTHAHGDHATRGCAAYLAAAPGVGVLRRRLGPDARVRGIEYGESLDIHGVRVSLHPAGHILGSASVRIEHGGEVWVVSGDYKTEPDPTCAPYEPIRCHTFVTECTFGLPIYRWPDSARVFGGINEWWRANQEAGRATLLFGYALGKAQRLIAGLDPTLGPILTHGAVESMTAAYRDAGVVLPPTTHVAAAGRTAWTRGIIVAPPSAHGSTWARRFGPRSTGFASGWMALRGERRRSSVDRGFPISDHVDWPALLDAIAATGAERVWATHGYTESLARWLREHGVDARAIATRYQGESEETAEPGDGEPAA